MSRSVRTLPRSLDSLRGLRAARWVRESTAGQYDRYGPDSQHENMDRFVERYALVDTGHVFTVAHSGRTVWRSDTMAAMLDGARAGEFDVLLTGYFDRWQRNLRRTLEIVEDVLHPSGVAWVMCDRRLLSSDPNDWDQMISEAHEAERYSRRLAGRISDGYEAKFRRLADPGGRPPRGFVRTGDAHVLAVDPETMPAVVALFARYASGVVSIDDLARAEGVTVGGLTALLKNPLYNGWAERKGERMPAPWRDRPPVDDDLWGRVADLRSRRRRHGGSRRPSPDRVDLLRGLLYCECGQRIRTDGTTGTPPRTRKMHPDHDRCPSWGRQACTRRRRGRTRSSGRCKASVTTSGRRSASPPSWPSPPSGRSRRRPPASTVSYATSPSTMPPGASTTTRTSPAPASFAPAAQERGATRRPRPT